jgi:hypothetical protein
MCNKRSNSFRGFIMQQLLNEREYDFLAYMQAGAEPKEEDKLEFQILEAQILRAWNQCCDYYNVTYNEFMVLPTVGADYLLRGRVWRV